MVPRNTLSGSRRTASFRSSIWACDWMDGFSKGLHPDQLEKDEFRSQAMDLLDGICQAGLCFRAIPALPPTKWRTLRVFDFFATSSFQGISCFCQFGSRCPWPPPSPPLIRRSRFGLKPKASLESLGPGPGHASSGSGEARQNRGMRIWRNTQNPTPPAFFLACFETSSVSVLRCLEPACSFVKVGEGEGPRLICLHPMAFRL